MNKIETFGDIDTDGTGEAFTDSWAYKVDGEWTYGGVNCTDGYNNFSEASCLYPVCDGVSVLGCMDDGSLEFDYDGMVYQHLIIIQMQLKKMELV